MARLVSPMTRAYDTPDLDREDLLFRIRALDADIREYRKVID